METMQDVIDRLQEQRDEHATTLARLDKAIEILRQGASINGSRSTSRTASTPARRTMSPAARRKISLAMKRRHAAAKSTRETKKLHWTQTPAGRKKFAAIRAKARRKAA